MRCGRIAWGSEGTCVNGRLLYTTQMLDIRCRKHGIELHFTKISHPWTNGQIERMNRTVKEATISRYHYDDHKQRRQHIDTFIAAYNYGRHLETLKGLTPCEFICKCWTNQPSRFRINPIHQMPGLNTWPDRKGEWISADGPIGPNHRRLSIIDLSHKGSQHLSAEVDPHERLS